MDDIVDILKDITSRTPELGNRCVRVMHRISRAVLRLRADSLKALEDRNARLVAEHEAECADLEFKTELLTVRMKLSELCNEWGIDPSSAVPRLLLWSHLNEFGELVIRDQDGTPLTFIDAIGVFWGLSDES